MGRSAKLFDGNQEFLVTPLQNYLVDDTSQWRSKWLCANTVVVRLEEGAAFYEQRAEVAGPAADTLFAQHLRARRATVAEQAS